MSDPTAAPVSPRPHHHTVALELLVESLSATTLDRARMAAANALRQFVPSHRWAVHAYVGDGLAVVRFGATVGGDSQHAERYEFTLAQAQRAAFDCLGPVGLVEAVSDAEDVAPGLAEVEAALHGVRS